MSDERYCSNCREELPKGAVVCQVCGVYAGDVFNGKNPKSPRAYASWIVIPLLVALVALIWAWYRTLPRTESARRRAEILRSVKKDGQHQMDVTQLIRRRLVANGLPESCLALVGKGSHESRKYLAIDICHDRPMGEWTADPDTGVVTRVR
ncbi:MAG TPA: hypothetical protein VHU41_00110 [Thermoanaerobaculia bacterium]|nr:hypothetical protein [Thermoanaerobaculia bacterium]